MEVRSVEAIVKALNDAEVQYIIVGGVAVNAHGYERATKDLDLVIGLQPDNILRGLHALDSIGYRISVPIAAEQFSDASFRERIRAEKNMIVLKLWSDAHRRTPIDVFVYEPFDFDQEYRMARRETVIGSYIAPIVRLETLLKMKREAGRLQDLADITDLERLQELKKEFPDGITP